MFGDHALFIVPAYIISLIVLVLLIIRLRLQYSACQRDLAELENSGIKRRSDKSDKKAVLAAILHNE